MELRFWRTNRRTVRPNQVVLSHSISQELLRASKPANGRASGPVLTCRFMALLNHSAGVVEGVEIASVSVTAEGAKVTGEVYSN